VAATTGSLIPARRVRSFPELGRSQAFTRCPALKMPRRFHAIRSTGRVYASTQVKRTRVRYFGSHPIVKALPLQVLSIKLLMHAQQDQGTQSSLAGSSRLRCPNWNQTEPAAPGPVQRKVGPQSHTSIRGWLLDVMRVPRNLTMRAIIQEPSGAFRSVELVNFARPQSPGTMWAAYKPLYPHPL